MEPESGSAEPADERAATITPYEDGPLLVRGAFRLRTPDGTDIDARRRTVALCRCGASGSKPFCDGSHRAVRFRAAVLDEQLAQPPDGG